MLKLGAHNSTAGGLHNAIAEAQAIGADALQVFCKNQRQWRAKPLEDDAVKAWHDALAASGLGPVMVHDSYLINMGNPDAGKREMSRQAFMDELARCDQLGVAYLNFHPGSHMNEAKAMRDDKAVRRQALQHIADAMQKCIDESKGSKVRLTIENAAGQGTNVGTTWEEVGFLLDTVANPARTAVTIDTQHSWACGYDWVDQYDEVWDAFDSAVGRRHLTGFHLNDSKMPCGSRVDRHDTIGEGQLGLEFFRLLVNDRRLDGLLGILETPEGPESWKREIALLRSLRLKDGEALPKRVKKGQVGLQAF